MSQRMRKVHGRLRRQATGSAAVATVMLLFVGCGGEEGSGEETAASGSFEQAPASVANEDSAGEDTSAPTVTRIDEGRSALADAASDGEAGQWILLACPRTTQAITNANDSDSGCLVTIGPDSVFISFSHGQAPTSSDPGSPDYTRIECDPAMSGNSAPIDQAQFNGSETQRLNFSIADQIVDVTVPNCAITVSAGLQGGADDLEYLRQIARGFVTDLKAFERSDQARGDEPSPEVTTVPGDWPSIRACPEAPLVAAASGEGVLATEVFELASQVECVYVTERFRVVFFIWDSPGAAARSQTSLLGESPVMLDSQVPDGVEVVALGGCYVLFGEHVIEVSRLDGMNSEHSVNCPVGIRLAEETRATPAADSVGDAHTESPPCTSENEGAILPNPADPGGTPLVCQGGSWVSGF